MANMSYCRFANTRRDMEDCIDALREAEWSEERISEDEIGYCRMMFDNIIDYLDEEGLINEFDWDKYSRWKEKLIEFCEG
jgi:hypothetical protein